VHTPAPFLIFVHRQNTSPSDSRPHLAHNIDHHIRHVVPTCGALNEIIDVFQLVIRNEPGGLTSRHIARSAYPASLAEFIVSSRVRSSLLWLFSQVDVVASLGHIQKMVVDCRIQLGVGSLRGTNKPA
jgi:hypothetical protein